MTAVLAAVLAAAFTVLGVATLAAVPAMRTAARHVGFTVDQYRVVGALEVAGALGVVAGLVVAPLGLAAAIGLALLMAGAFVAHILHGADVRRATVPVVVGAALVLYLAAIA